MLKSSTKILLASAAVALAMASAAAGSRAARRSVDAVASQPAPASLEPFALASLLAEAPPDTVVITLDPPRHPMRGALSLAAFGASDDALVAGAPKARRIVLAAVDVVRQDRLARRLSATGRDVRVLATGVDGWDRAMDSDPPSPGANAPRGALESFRRRVALRRSFGDAAPVAAAPVAAPVLAGAAAGGGAPKKHEGC